MKTKVRIKALLLMLILNTVVAVNSFAQIPLVYEVENTGASCTAPPLPAPNQLTSYANLPDPFAWSNSSGRIASFSDWKCRRNEIKQEIEKYEIGVKPPKPGSVTATYSGGTLTVRVTENGQTLTLTSSFTIPSGIGPFPAVIGMNAPTGQLPANLFNGCIQIRFNHDQVVTYANGSGSINSADPYFKLYPNTNIGKYSAWSWGISRLIDGLELVQSQINIDMKRIAITGCSYAGKMALFGGAFDERIAFTIAQESGGGGINSWRVSETIGNVEKIDNTNYSWFMPSLRTNFQAPNVGKLPHDHHELIAMIAPRAFLALGNPPFVWLGDESGYVSVKAAQEVWKTFGVPERFGFSFRDGHDHCTLPSASNSEVTAFVDKFLRNNTSANTNIQVHPFSNTDYLKWIDAWDGYVLPPVNTSGPIVSLTSPVNNATYAVGANIAITADASDADGNVTKVEFYNGTTKLGEDATSPYSYAWDSVAEGSYSITAVATDNAGNKTTSAAVKIVVGNPRTPLITNGEFDLGTTGWDIQNNGGATGTITVVTYGNLSGTNSLRICPTAPGTLEWHVQVRQNAPLTAGKNYRVSFMAKADAARPMTVSVQQEGDPYTTHYSQTVDLTTSNQMFTFDFNAAVSDATSKLKFYVGNNSTCVLIDKVELSEGNFQLSATATPAGVITFCSGGSVVLNANTGTGYTYQWKRDGANINGATAVSYTAIQSGIYSVTIMDNSQAATSQGVTVTVNSVPSVPAITSPVNHCQNSIAAALTATGTSLKWYTVPSSGISSMIAPVPSASSAGTTNYYVSQTMNGCESPRAMIAVTINATPGAPTVSFPVTYCQNERASALTATGTSLKWYTVPSSGTSSTIAPVPSTSSAGTTNYYVSQTMNGCESPRAMIVVAVNTTPSASITLDGPATFIEGGSVTLNANTGSGLTYKWLNRTFEVGTGSSYTTTGSGSYKVEITNASGCKAVSPVTNVTVNANQPSVITIHSPLANSTITENKITFDITAQDPDGDITKVEYYSGGALIGISTRAPYIYEWNNPGIGTHDLLVKVTDSNGGVTSSGTVTVTVNIATGILSGGYNVFTGISPNPSNEFFKLTSNSKIKTLRITNLYGREMEGWNELEADQTIEIGRDLSEGTYLVIIEYASGAIEVARLVKLK